SRPEREKAAALANSLPRKVVGVALTDPMSGLFMIRTEVVRRDADRPSGIGFKILLDILATADQPLRVRESPLRFAARTAGESQPDRTIVFEFLVGLYVAWLGWIVPTRFALFGTSGGVGVIVHMAVLGAFLTLFGGSFEDHVTGFEVGQSLAALVAMTFNFVL